MPAAQAITVLVVAGLLATVAASSPQVNFPLSSQFPPVARIGEAYSFQFASNTFQPDSDKLQYSLIENPSWLSLNGQTRTLGGTPGPGDAGMVAFTIVAAREAGAVANMESQLFVADHDAPKANGNISQQLSGAGSLSGPKTLTFLPSMPFNIMFPSDLFETNGENFSYHATLLDHTPLPAWIAFNAPSLQFAGTTPPLLSSLPQSYGIILLASDVPGFAEASISFTLAVSNHQLLFKPLQQTINYSKGGHVNISDLRDKAFLDDVQIGNDEIQSATAEIPSWLSFNNTSFDITGTPPAGLMSQDLTITVRDQFGDTANHSIHLNFQSDLFAKEVGRLNITAGQAFEYIIPRSLFTTDSGDVSVEFGSLTEWLRFNTATLTISGTLPDGFGPQDFQGSLTATSTDRETNDTQNFELHVSGPGTHVYAGNTVAGQSDTFEVNHHDTTKKVGIIIGAVLASTFALAVLLAVAVLLCRRKRKSKGSISPRNSRSPRSPRKIDISRPIFIEDEWEDLDKTAHADLENGVDDDAVSEKTPQRPPRLDLQLPTKRNIGHGAMTSIDEGDTKILTAFDRSSWGFKDEAGPSHHPHESMKIPTEMAKINYHNSSIPDKHRRRSTPVYRDSYRSSGLPVRRRLTGLGHGRHTLSPTRNNNNFWAYRRPMSFNSYSTRSTSILSTAPSALPQPPAARHTTQLTAPMKKRRSIRLVAASTCDSLTDGRTIDEKRKSYIKKRASNQSPFFGASASRVSASSHKSLPEGFSMETLSPPMTNVVVRPKEDTVNRTRREYSDNLRIRKPSETPTVESPPAFKDSLRRPPKKRYFTHRHTTSVATNRDSIQNPCERPETAVYDRELRSRRSSTRDSFRAQELKSTLNRLTNSRKFEDAELSASVYSTEEEDIEECENSQTLRTNQFRLSPLKLPGLRIGKSNSKRDSKRELERASQREATPYSLAFEHGGKENNSSTYSLNEPVTTKAKGKGKATAVPPSPSPERERPKTITSQRKTRLSYNIRTGSRITNRSNTQARPLSRHLSDKSRPLSRSLSNESQTRHSRKSQHLYSRSRQPTTKNGRDHSRTQSSAFPYFDPSTIQRPTTATSTGKSDKENDNHTSMQKEKRPSSFLSRDLSGNITDYALHKDPKIEELASRSIGIRTSNGRISTSARALRLAQLHSHQHSYSRSSKHGTTIGSRTPFHSPSNSHSQSVGVSLDLSLLGGGTGHVEEALSPDKRRRERTPLSVLEDGNGGSTERESLRIIGRGGRREKMQEDRKEREDREDREMKMFL